MEKEYVIFCDESDQRGAYFSSFYGGVIVGGSVINQVSARLNAAKTAAGIQSEVKWSKVGPRELVSYKPLIQEFFQVMEERDLRMRLMFRQNMHEATNLTREDHANAYFKLYYQFLKHGFGLQYMPTHPKGVRLRFYLDQLPDQSREKKAQFRGYVAGLAQNSRLRKAGLSFAEEDIAEVNSKQHILLQCADVVLGSMSFRLNDKHKAIPEGQRRRGKRTVAKEEMYKFIRREICNVTGKHAFNPGISTGVSQHPEGRWSDPYLHWLFVPSEMRIDAKYKKRR
jgi:hypothetical protein